MKTKKVNKINKTQTKYIIDYQYGSGSGCDTRFNSIEEAEKHMSFYTDKEKEGLVIVQIEVEVEVE